jgi:hypothetical protein
MWQNATLFGMDYAVWVYLACFLISVFGSTLCTLAFMAGFLRRCTKLEWALGDLQQRASTFRGREMADKRWTKEKQLDQEMASVLHATSSPRRKYDNDPLGE